MPSYKKHALFSIIIALPFIPDVFYLSLALIGASIVDMDHHVKKKNLILMSLLGIILSILLYILNLPFLFGIALIFMALIFYISKHRGFSHSIFGTLLSSFLLAFFVIGFYSLVNGFGIENKLSLILISIILGIITLNKKILLPFIILVTLGVILTSNQSINPYLTFFGIFLGYLSHLILDLFTPSGIKILNPLSSKKFNKCMGIVLFILWGLGAFIFNFKYIILS